MTRAAASISCATVMSCSQDIQSIRDLGRAYSRLAQVLNREWSTLFLPCQYRLARFVRLLHLMYYHPPGQPLRGS
jgi:hypothetical protein